MSDPAVEPVEEPAEPTEPAEEPTEEPTEEPVEPTEEPDPAKEPTEPTVEASFVDAEAIFKKIGTAFTAYTRKVGDALGDEATNIIPCPVCSETIPGFVDQRAVGQFPDDVRRQVMRFLGFATEQDYEPSQTQRRCGECAGKGQVTTGSTVPNHETVACPTCKGYGYVPPPGAGQVEAGAAPVVPFAPTAPVPVAPQEDVDEWGEPRILPDGRENPNFGKMPHRKVLVEPYGVTANLRAEPAYVPVPGEVVE